MSDLIRKDASELAGLVSSGEVSAVEVAQAHLDRIAAVDGDVHAFLHVDTEGALASAAAVDAKVKAGDKLSVLAGWPLGSLPMGLVDGLPVGIGVAARANDEKGLIRAMAIIERVIDLGEFRPSFIR